MNTVNANNGNAENPYIAIDKKWARRKRVFKILIVALVFSSPAIYRSSLLWRISDVEEPFDMQEFVSYSPAKEENAFTFYRRAASKLTSEPRIPPPNATPADKGVTAPLSRSLDEIEFCNQPGVAHQKEWEKWLDENKQTLLDWKEGTTRTESLHILPAEMEIDTLLETTQQLRLIKLLVMVKAKLLTEVGQLDESWSWYRALVCCQMMIRLTRM